MTGIDLSDINVDLTYQDGLRLSELYGELGAIQYDLEHIVMSSLLPTALLCLLVGFLYLMFMSVATDYIKEEWFCYNCEYANSSDPWVWNKWGKYAYALICVGMIALLILIFYGIFVGVEYVMDYYLNRKLVSTQMQIDAILMKYGWEGI